MGPAKRSGHPKSLAVLVLAGVVLGSLALPAHGQSADAHVARLGAAAVKKGLDRNRASNNPNFAPDFRTAFASVEVTGPLSVRLNLSQPISGEFFEFLAGRETMIVSPKAIDDGVNIDEHPVGAGAYQFVSFAREEK